MKILDMALAVIGLSFLVAYLAILVSYIDKLPLTIVCLIGVACAAYDFWRTFFRRANNNGGAAPR